LCSESLYSPSIKTQLRQEKCSFDAPASVRMRAADAAAATSAQDGHRSNASERAERNRRRPPSSAIIPHYQRYSRSSSPIAIAIAIGSGHHEAAREEQRTRRTVPQPIGKKTKHEKCAISDRSRGGRKSVHARGLVCRSRQPPRRAASMRSSACAIIAGAERIRVNRSRTARLVDRRSASRGLSASALAGRSDSAFAEAVLEAALHDLRSPQCNTPQPHSRHRCTTPHPSPQRSARSFGSTRMAVQQSRCADMRGQID
jgi:hypothetical protein